MQNFEYYARTKIIFGKETENSAGSETALHARRALLHHSGGHAVKSGLIDRIKDSLKAAGVEWVELGGVQPNPRLSLVYKGIDIVKKEKLGCILGVGGGSAIDSAKAIALGAANDGDVWDFFERKKTASQSLPVGAVVTIPAAGSESSNSCVITNEAGPWKRGVNAECNRPVFAILNPELTYSLPPYQTACGICDMMAHIMERYFTREPNVELTDELCEGALRAIIRNARRIFSGGEKDYAARAEIMWAGTLAHNNLLGTGRVGDWASHPISHEITALFETAHGAALSIIFPAWMQYNIKASAGTTEDTARFARFAAKVWGVDGAFYGPEQAALEGIFRMKNFFRSIGLPVSLAEANIDASRIGEMAHRAVKFGPLGNFRKLEEKDIEAIYRIAGEM
ncbi:MAG: iron-containing alcohol dehydrogenase [Treponema sp.]|nr:iron-containing alcohol dehydrogenase [Treponema sp.]